MARLADVSEIAGFSALLLPSGLLTVAAALTLPGLCAPASGPVRIRTRPSGRQTVLATTALAVLLLVVFAPEQVSPLGAALALIAAILAAASPSLGASRAASRRLGIAADVLLIVAIVLLTVDVTGYWQPGLTASSWSALPPNQIAPIAQIHQNFYLGPVNDLLHGRALLVEANAVYGIGTSYAIAAWFGLLPFGYGTFGLLGGLATAGMIALGWAVIRVGGAPRVIAALAVIVGVTLTVLAPVTSTALFVNVGGLRFGPPFVLLAVALLACGRSGPVSHSPWVVATFAFFTLWSVEAIVYCTCVYAALICLEALACRRLRTAVSGALRSVGYVLAAGLLMQLAFAILTRVLGGGWPDWGAYVSLFEAWSSILANVFGAAVEPWSTAWLVGGVYLASAVGVSVLVRRRGMDAPDARRAAVAIGGLTATGVSLLSYFIAHSAELFVPFVAYPAVLLGALWLSLGQRASVAIDWRRALVGVAAGIGALLVAGSWSNAAHRLPRTALAHLVPGGPTLGQELRLMWSNPAIDQRATAAEALIERYFPPDYALVLIEPDLGQEALFGSGRANLLPISYPWQDEVDLPESLPKVEDAVAELAPGTRMLMQDPPGSEPISASLLFEQTFGNVPEGQRLGPLAAAAMDEISARFEFRELATGPDGLRVVELVPR